MFRVWQCSLLLLIFVFSGCGKIGDPLPPIPKAPLIVEDLKAKQQGTNIVLSFPVAKETRTEKLKRVEIYRLIESSSQPVGLTPEDFAARAELRATLLALQLPANASEITYTDPVDFAATKDAVRYRYAVRLINMEERPSELSNYATISPIGTIAAPPQQLNQSLTQYQITLSWQIPSQNLNGTQPANVFGYNLYRREGATFVRVNQDPLRSTTYIEKQFQFGKKYDFFVRALSLPNLGAPLTELIESDLSAILSFTPIDTFAPTAPNSITIASRGGIVSLFWPANPEPDVVGYTIYRSEDEKSWRKITARPITTITYSDKNVVAGKRYFYQLVAVDQAGNESSRSEIVSEIADPN